MEWIFNFVNDGIPLDEDLTKEEYWEFVELMKWTIRNVSEDALDKIIEFVGKDLDDFRDHKHKITYMVRRISDLSFEDKKKIIDSPEIKKYLVSLNDYLEYDPEQLAKDEYPSVGRLEAAHALHAIGGITGVYPATILALCTPTAVPAVIAGTAITIGGLLATGIGLAVAKSKRLKYERKLGIVKQEKLENVNKNLSDIKKSVSEDVAKIIKLKRRKA